MVHLSLPLSRSSARDGQGSAPFFRTCALAAAFFLGLSTCGPEPEPPANRLLIIGWDGATFDLIDPLLAAGRLPNVARLLDRGTSANLESTIIPISSAAWVAAVTGKGPGKTGVYSFFEPVEGTYDVEVISSLSNRAAPLWRILGDRGLAVHVLGVPITFPPETVEGTLVAGMLSPFDATYASPPELTDELRERGFEPDLGIWREAHGPTPQRLEDQLTIKREIVLEQLGADDWDFAMVVFKSLDVVSHGVFSLDPDGIVARLADRLDATLGDILDTVGEDTNVILMSDHGFRRYPRAFNLHAFLAEAGVSPLRADAEGPQREETDLATARPREHKRRMGELDLARTRAFATACEGNFGSLRLNIVGREPEGVVRPDDAEQVLAEITAKLREARAGNAAIVTNVLRGHELYPGPEAGRIVPDLLFETREDIQVVAKQGRPVLEAYGVPFPDHARDGIFVAAGPDIMPLGRTGTRARFSVVDIAPLALHLLHLPVPHEMDGSVPAGVCAPGREVQRIHEADDPLWPTLENLGRRFGNLDPETAADVEHRLESLGYTD